MANDTLKTELPDTSAWKPDWTDSFKTQSTSPESTNVALNAVLDLVDPNVNTEAVNALNQFGGAYGTSFSLAGTGPTNPLYQPTEEDKGLLDDLRHISDIDISQDTMDKIFPAIAIGGGEILRYAAGRDFSIPEGWKPRIRAGGSKGVAYTLAIRGARFGRDFAKEKLGMTEGASTLVGGASAVGIYNYVPAIASTIANEVKVGMATEVMDVVAKEASTTAYREVVKKGLTEGGSDFAVRTAADQASDQAGKEISDKVATEMKKRIGKEASKGWDDVAKKLMNPSVSARVGRYLAHAAPGTARKLALSGVAFAFPEWVSTAAGFGGILWTAWDIFNLAKSMPDLYPLIFEDAPEGTPKGAVEDQLVDQMTQESSPFEEQGL